MRTLRQDIAYALRQMRQSPIFTLTAMLTLALGIGATTAIFSLIHTVMLKSLPVADPATLYRVGEGNDCCVNMGPEGSWGLFPYALYQRFQAAAPEFEQMAAFQAGRDLFSVRRSESDGQAKPLHAEYVSGNYFSTFGIQAYAGRTLAPADDQRGAPPAAMLTHRAWQQVYGADPNIVGATFLIDGHPFTIVGMAQSAVYDKPMIQMIDDRSHIIEAAVLQMQGSTEGLESQVRRAFSEVDPNLTLVGIRPMAQQVADRLDQDRTVAQLTGLFGLLALILAGVGLYGVTAYNVERRTREIGVRIAMGANRSTVIELVLKGAFLQIVIGLLIGVPASIGCARLIASKLYQVHGWDPLVLCGAVLALGFCALVASLVPARKPAAVNPVTALRVE